MSYEMIKFDHSDHWSYRATLFAIEIIRWNKSPRLEDQTWNLYIYIDKGHPMYEEAKSWEDAFDCTIELHGGCTYLKQMGDHVKIGCDYAHWGDEATRVLMDMYKHPVYYDALELIERLNHGN
jgi:hypothetical protein